MNRLEALTGVLEEAGVAHTAFWLRQERKLGEEGAILEMCALFCAIKLGLVKFQDTDWLDWRVQEIQSRAGEKSAYERALCDLAIPELNRAALMQVIREKQLDVVYQLFGLHDGSGEAPEAAKGINFMLAYENRDDEVEDEDERRMDRVRVFPNKLGRRFTDFMTETIDTTTAKAESDQR